MKLHYIGCKGIILPSLSTLSWSMRSFWPSWVVCTFYMGFKASVVVLLLRGHIVILALFVKGECSVWENFTDLKWA